MGSNFELAIPVILRHEGGYYWVEGDAGGETNFGISKRSYPDIDIKNLTSADASVIYKRDWWDHYDYGRIDAQVIGTKVLDMAVNMGAKSAHKIVQQALNTIRASLIACDGVLGSQTIAAVNAAAAATLLPAIQGLQANHYRNIVLARPQDAKFLDNWLHRAYDC
jgi:lysozyme family protein